MVVANMVPRSDFQSESTLVELASPVGDLSLPTPEGTAQTASRAKQPISVACCRRQYATPTPKPR